MKKILVSLFTLVLVLSGCGGSGGDKPSATCTNEINGYELETKIYSNDDKVEKLVYTMTQKDLVKDVSDAERKAGAKIVESEFDDYKGVEAEIDFDGDDMIVILTLDLTELEEFPSSFGVNMPIDKIKDASYKELVETLEENGGSCKEN